MKKICLILLMVLPLVLSAQIKPVVKQEIIPGSTVGYKMALIPGGKFIMGSPETEKGRGADEGLHEVTLDSFWIGVCEVTFDEFFLFQFRSSDSDVSPVSGFSADAVARPSPPYYDFTYGRGKAGGYPATTMTQQAALRYCSGFRIKRVISIAFQPRQNGNVPAGQVPSLHGPGVIIRKRQMSMHGFMTTARDHIKKRVPKNPTPGACTICTAMPWNTASIPTRPTIFRDSTHHRQTRRLHR
jgi:hypothetical protein